MPTHEIFEWAGSDAPQCLDDRSVHLDPGVKRPAVLEPATREVVRHELLYVPR
jgi:hypothetical protein